MLTEFESVAKKMAAQFEEQHSRLSHNGVRGRVRELTVVQEFLQPYLPDKYSVGSGLIINAAGEKSTQQDIVIYDRFNSPVLQDQDEVKLFFVEQVLATIEVKSTLETSDALNLVNTAERNLALRNYVNSRGSKPLVPFHTFGFAYNGRQQLRTLRDKLDSYTRTQHSSWRPTALLVLEDSAGMPGIVQSMHPVHIHKVSLQPTEDNLWASLHTESRAVALMKFFLVLMAAISDVSNRRAIPDFWAYARMDEGSNNHVLEIGPEALKQSPLHEWLRILEKPSLHADDAILRAYYSVNIVGFESVPAPPLGSLIFLEDGDKVRYHTGLVFSDILAALSRYVADQASLADHQLLAELLQALKFVESSDGALIIGSVPKQSS